MNPLNGTLTCSLMILPLLFYALYIYIQYQEVRDQETIEEKLDSKALKSWGKLVISIVLFTIGVEMLLLMVINLGEIFDTPSYFWVATIVAAATSIPDLFGLTNGFGSNTFDLLVVLPAGVIVVGAVGFNCPRIVPMMMFLILAAVTVTVLVPARNGVELTNNNGKLLLLLYVGFILGMGTEYIGTGGDFSRLGV
ncbi:MAG: cation:H+ antiporter [Halioglobus sp.]